MAKQYNKKGFQTPRHTKKGRGGKDVGLRGLTAEGAVTTSPSFSPDGSQT